MKKTLIALLAALPLISNAAFTGTANCSVGDIEVSYDIVDYETHPLSDKLMGLILPDGAVVVVPIDACIVYAEEVK